METFTLILLAIKLLICLTPTDLMNQSVTPPKTLASHSSPHLGSVQPPDSDDLP